MLLDLSLEGATIATSILDRPLEFRTIGMCHDGPPGTTWKSMRKEWHIRIFDSFAAYRTIPFFETGAELGLFDIEEDRQIIGLSVGDSIYVPKRVSSNHRLFREISG